MAAVVFLVSSVEKLCPSEGSVCLYEVFSVSQVWDTRDATPRRPLNQLNAARPSTVIEPHLLGGCDCEAHSRIHMALSRIHTQLAVLNGLILCRLG